MLSQNELNEALYWAIKEAHIQEIAHLLEQGASVNHPSVADWTPLGHACDLGYIEIVKLLIERGADVNLCDSDGLSPLYWARERGHSDIAKLLLGHGAEG